MKKLEGKTALITGASRGIGKSIAQLFAEQGADLIITARSKDELAALKEELLPLDVRVVVIPTDLHKPEEIQSLAAQSLAAFEKIDILVNNAGVGTWAPVLEISLQDYNDMFDVNVRAIFLLTQALLPSMIARQDGHIVNIGSTSSRYTYPEGTVYCASKFAVLGFTEALAKELRTTGVRATAICPGQVNTYLGGTQPDEWEKDMLEGEDVAQLVLAAVTMPPHVIVTELVFWPKAENF